MSSEQDLSGSDRPASGESEPLVSPLDDGPGAQESAGSQSVPVAAGAARPQGGPAVEPSPHTKSPNMLPGREVRRSGFERMIVRLVATCGIVGIGVAIAAIMVSSKSQGWIVGLVVSIVSVILAALLWSSRML